MQPLILYDVLSNLPGKDWSPNPAKTRFVLGYKNLPFETVWVEYADIAAKPKEIGASPNKFPNGIERYTVPTLSDPNTGALVTDSWAIAEYLDKTYPQKPIFPNNSMDAINVFYDGLRALVESTYQPFGILRASELLSERSREYFVRVREAFLGYPPDEWSPEGPKREAHWAMIENYYASAKVWYERVEGKWLMGDAFSYADVLFAVNTLSQKRVYRDDEWKRIASLHDGKWDKLLKDVEKECNLA